MIRRMPEGIETKVGTLGSKLSGGERQRINLARTFIRDVPIMMFDEPTSSLDNSNEKLVINMLNGDKFKGKTKISIAHKLNFKKTEHHNWLRSNLSPR